MDITEARQIMRCVAQGNIMNRAWQGQEEAAQVLLKELARLEAKVAQYELIPTCTTCQFMWVSPDNSPCNCCRSHSNRKLWEPEVTETAIEQKEATD